MSENIIIGYGFLILVLTVLFIAYIALSIFKAGKTKKKPQNEVFINDEEWS